MNIFATDLNPVTAAKNLCDQHVNKMIVESGQMLSNAFDLDRLAEDDCPRNAMGNPRSHGYARHPCTLWACESKSNMLWLIQHALAMCMERQYRWSKDHFTKDFIMWCLENIEDSLAPDLALTDFAVAISQDAKAREHPVFDRMSTVDKYREYYRRDKGFGRWTKRKEPYWLN
jgi:hypothetical protein